MRILLPRSKQELTGPHGYEYFPSHADAVACPRLCNNRDAEVGFGLILPNLRVVPDISEVLASTLI